MHSIRPVLVTFVAISFVAAAPALGSAYTLMPIDDTFAYSGEPDLAHGSLSGIATGFTFPHPEAGWVSYLKFDLSAIPADEVITEATLNLYKFIVGTGFAQLGTNLFRLADDGWSEGTLTWNNQPLGLNGIGAPNFGTLVASNPDGFAYVGWSAWNLFDKAAWNPVADQADGLLSLQLGETYGGDQGHNWCSKESDPTYCPAVALHQPYLQITTMPDADGDGAPDSADNCTLTANPSQLDANQDGYGNACDADLNNSGLVTTADFGILRSVLNQAAGSSATAAAADLNGSGTVTTADFGILRDRLNGPPGPSGWPCAGTIPCP
jgi:hypothetical protein